MSNLPIRLGVFDLYQVIGRGAVGEVWQGIHRGQGVPVAVKVLGGDRVHDELALEAFQTEVRAVAALTHPGIILLFDHGTVDTRAVLTSHGRLVPGSPYLVMELASGGSLGSVELRSWSQVRYVLLSLLDALGHAHARDVLHRDLKPGNVVICGEDDPRPGLKLTDFGIARAFESRVDEGEVEVTGGTPRFMAPEQFRGRFRDAGPWTDLYALGCIAFELVTGGPPFTGETTPMLAAAHMMTPPPPLIPRFSVPDGVEAWIRRLLAKKPRDRFRRAADAAWGLIPLGSGSGMPVSSFEASFKGERLDVYEVATIKTTPLDRSRVEAFDPLATVVTSFRDELGVGAPQWSGGHMELERPDSADAHPDAVPVPETWRAPIVERPSLKLVGAGLGLFGFRAIPLVGRTRERDVIWSALRMVAHHGTPHVIVIEGSAGVGKTRLVEWTAARGHELGAASVLRATHAQRPAPDHGLGRMMARHLRCVGLGHGQALAHVRRNLEAMGVSDPYEWRGLTAVALSEGDGRVRFHSRIERYALLRRHLVRLAAERPLIVWLDDVQWGRDAMGFVRYVLGEANRQPCPILFLLTHRGGELPELEGCNNVEQLRLPSLPTGAHRELIGEILGLAPDLAHSVAERTAGNPLFAIELVGDWVDRGILVLGEDGFDLRGGETDQIPDGIHDVWRWRLDQLLDGQPPSAKRVVEMAAVLGESLLVEEWHALSRVCTMDGRALLRHALSSRLVGSAAREIHFAHRMLRESILRIAEEAGRLPSHHAACADVLERLYRPEGLQGERVADHLFQAGAWNRCLTPLLRAAEERVERAEYDKAELLLARYDSALGALGVADEDVRRICEHLVRANMASRRGDTDYMREAAENSARLAESQGWGEILGRARLLQARLAHENFELDRATSFYNDALDAFGGSEAPTMQVAALPRSGLSDSQSLAAWYGGSGDGRIEVLLGLGEIAFRQSQLERATVRFDRALEASQLRGDGRLMVQALHGLGLVKTATGDTDGAYDVYRSALQFAEDQGHRFYAATIRNGMGEVERSRGNLEAAVREYQTAVALFSSIGSERAEYARTNWGLCLLQKRRFRRAKEQLDVVRQKCETRGRPELVIAVHGALAACAAGVGDLAGMDPHLGTARRALREVQALDADDAWPLHRAGDLVARRDVGRARDAYALALEIWESLGCDDEIGEVRRAMEALADAPVSGADD